MSQSLRTFIGVPVPTSAALRAVLATCGEFGRAVRPVDAENIHVTLRFLGDTPAGQIAGIGKALQDSVREIEAFSTEIHGLGAFPHLGRPSVIWAGFRESAEWEALADAIEQPLREFGFPPDRQRFHPHVTLARVRSRPPAELKAWVEEQGESPFGSFEVQSVTYYQSELSSNGPRYSVLATAPLAST
jgi:RNA 2',3'-cyclic 3'-phosphodiesterase